MKLGNAGEAFFVEQTKEFSDSEAYLATSPILKRKSSLPTTALESAPVTIGSPILENKKKLENPKNQGKEQQNTEANQEENVSHRHHHHNPYKKLKKKKHDKKN